MDTDVLYRACETVIKGQKGLDSSRKIIKMSLKIVYPTLPSTLLAPGMFTPLYILAVLLQGQAKNHRKSGKTCKITL